VPQVVYFNGEYVPVEKAFINVYDHGILYGDGIFEGIRCYDGNIFRLKQHLRRLWDSAQYMGIPIPISMEEMEVAHAETLRRCGLRDSYIRTVLSRGVGDLGIDPRKCSKPTLYIIAGKIAMFPESDYENGIAAITASSRRVGNDTFNPRVKTLNYVNNIMAKMEATNAGVRDALMLNSMGYIVECTAANFFALREGVLTTPACHVGALRGITRDAVIEIARGMGLTVKEDFLTQYDAYVAEETFITGTGAEIMPITKIDNRVIGKGSCGATTRAIREKFKALVKVDGYKI